MPQVALEIEDIEKGQPPGKHGSRQGDLDARSPLSSDYFELVRRKSKHKSYLECLYQFMDPTTKGFAVRLSKRMKDFDVKIIQFSGLGTPPLIERCCTPEEFQQAISKERETIGTVVIAKGLSRAMVEVLGATYELEPEFFASHLGGTECFRTGHFDSPLMQPPARRPHLMPNHIRKAPFYTVEYRRPCHVTGGDQMVYRLRGTVTNTPRAVSIIEPGLPDVFACEKISVYKKTGSKIGMSTFAIPLLPDVSKRLTSQRSLGIILTDQLLSDLPAASHIPSPISLLNEDTDGLDDGTDATGHQISARSELMRWMQKQNPDEIKAIFDDKKQLAFEPVLEIAERFGVMFLLHARFMLSRIECRNCDTKFPNSIPFLLRISRSLHYIVHQQQRLLHGSMVIASLRGGDDEQKEDLDFLNRDLDKMLNAIEEQVKFLVGEASVREGKIVGWVSKFAALFLPVSLLATILSISDPSFVKWAILGGLSVPFVLISMYLMFLFPKSFEGLNS